MRGWWTVVAWSWACSASVPSEHASAVADPVQVRTADARARLAQSEGGQLLAEIVEAHGGLERWYGAESLRFTFDYVPAGKPEARRHSVNTVHLATSRVRQEQVGGDAVFGWDGQQAWIAPDASAFPSPARFWALTPYYFVGMPFVLADPGTRHDLLSDGEVDGQPVRRVRVSFDPGTGDAPDDYYVVHADPESLRMVALTYIVTSDVVFPDGGRSGEKRLSWLDPVRVGGLWFAGRYEGVAMNGDEPGASVSSVRITDIAVDVVVSDETFAPVAGATTGL